LEVSTLKDIKTILSLGMTAPEVVIRIVEATPEIRLLLLKVYSSAKNLEEEPVIQIRTSVDRMIYHNPPELEETIWLERNEITLERIKEIADRLAEKRALAITSSVKLFNTEEIFHIPMMDFKCEASPENLEKIQEFLRKIGQKGVVLLSGRSYHYYGIELLSERDWLLYLGKCLLFIDFVDSRYVGHRLIDGYTSLRISREIRRPNLPKVVAIV